MKITERIARPIWAWFVGSIALLGVVLAVRHYRPISRSDAAATLAALRAESSALPATNAVELTRWRERQAALATQRWTESVRIAFEKRLGARWQWTETEASSETRQYRVEAAAPATLPWQEIVAAVTTLEATPGLTVESIAVTTSGTRTVRTFATVEIRLRLQWTRAGTGNTVPPESVRRDRVRSTAGFFPERATEGRARPALLRRSVRLRQASGYRPAPRRVRPDHPWLVRLTAETPRASVMAALTSDHRILDAGEVSRIQSVGLRRQHATTGTANTVPPKSIRRDRVLPTAGLSPERAAGRRARCGRSLPSASALRLRLINRLRLRAPAPVRPALRPARPPAARPGGSEMTSVDEITST